MLFQFQALLWYRGSSWKHIPNSEVPMCFCVWKQYGWLGKVTSLVPSGTVPLPVNHPHRLYLYTHKHRTLLKGCPPQQCCLDALDITFNPRTAQTILFSEVFFCLHGQWSVRVVFPDTEDFSWREIFSGQVEDIWPSQTECCVEVGNPPHHSPLYPLHPGPPCATPFSACGHWRVDS